MEFKSNYIRFFVGRLCEFIFLQTPNDRKKLLKRIILLNILKC